MEGVSIGERRGQAVRGRGWTLSNTQFALLLLLPALAVLAYTIFYPLGRAIYLSFTDYSLINPLSGRWVGLQNFKILFAKTSPFFNTWKVTLIFVTAAILSKTLIGFTAALALNQKIILRNTWRGLLLVPWIVPTVVCGYLWKWIFNQQYGVFNHLLVNVLHVLPEFRGWTSDPSWALFTVTVADIWKGIPFHMIVLLAGLQTIPEEVIEAAIIDGANAFQRFSNVTLPYLRYIIMVSTLLSIIWTFQQFSLIWIMTEGGPITATTTLSIGIYRTAFQAFDMGKGAAIGTTWLVFILTFSLVFVRLFGGEARAAFE